MSNDFSICLGDELVALSGQLFFQLDVVLDNSVVHHHDFGVAIAMGMGILFSGTSMSCPAGVANTINTLKRGGPDRFLEVAQLSGCPANLEFAVFADYGDSRRVIP